MVRKVIRNLITAGAVLLVSAFGAWAVFIAPERYRSAILLKGAVVTPEKIIAPGWVLISRGVIQSVSSHRPDAAGAVEIDTQGLIFPGLINLHDHVAWNVFPRWDPGETFLNRYEWRQEAQAFREISAAFQGLKPDHFCRMNAYGEIRALVGGTTSIMETGMDLCVRGLVRNLDVYSGFYTLPIIQDRAHIRNLINLPNRTDRLRKFLNDDTSEAFFIHLSEGVDAEMRAEFDQLEGAGLLTDKTAIIHGIALESEEFERMRTQAASLIWSPRSNLELYGRTADITSALDAGVRVAIAPDWGITGSANILDELRVATAWNAAALDSRLSERQLVEMVTRIPAEIAGISELVGTISPGKYADLLVVSGDASQPYRSLLEADPAGVQLVLVAGVPEYGALTLMEVFWTPDELASIEIAGAVKAVRQPDLPEIAADLQTAMSAHGFELAPLAEEPDPMLLQTLIPGE